MDREIVFDNAMTLAQDFPYLLGGVFEFILTYYLYRNRANIDLAPGVAKRVQPGLHGRNWHDGDIVLIGTKTATATL